MKASRFTNSRGTPRKLACYIHWTQKRGAKKKMALAVKRRSR